MIGQLLDLFDFLSVLLRGGALVFQSLTLGGAVFGLWVLKDPALHNLGRDALEICRRLLCWSGAILGFIHLCTLAMRAAILADTAELGLEQIVGASFFFAGAAGVLTSTAIVALTLRPSRSPGWYVLALSIAGLAVLVATSHAAGRLEHRLTLCALTALHQAATAVWIGGMPYLVAALARSPNPNFARRICYRFSCLAAISVGTLAASGTMMSLTYVGAVDAIYGTSYGIMILGKAAMLGALLLLGAVNFSVIHRRPGAAGRLLSGVRRFAEAEVGIGFTVILAAASLTSQPPAVDLVASGRVSGREIIGRLRPLPPRLATPQLSALSPATALTADAPSRDKPAKSESPDDIAWSEYNHHWAGLVVLTVGLLAILSRSGIARWARHWPLGFLGLAVFLFLRADPENWPLGPRGFWESFAVVEVLQHRLFVLMIVTFTVFEWRVQTGRLTSQGARLVFPLVCAIGGALLVTHAHSLGNPKEEFLAELSHLPLAILAVFAGWSRWLEVRLANDRQKIPAYIWPICFTLIGLVLLNYREA